MSYAQYPQPGQPGQPVYPPQQGYAPQQPPPQPQYQQPPPPQQQQIMQPQGFTIDDPYLNSPACTAIPEQNIVLDPNFHNIRMRTPIGRGSYLNLAKARAVQQGQEPKFSGTLLLNPVACRDLYHAINLVANARWPQEARVDPATGQQVMMTGAQLLTLPKQQGGLHNPLRNGNDMYMLDAVKHKAYKGVWFINCGVDETNRNTGQRQQPVLLDEDAQPVGPDKFYSGMYVVFLITVYAFPKPGAQIPNRGVGILLNAVQIARHGEKLATFDALKQAQAGLGTIARDPNAPPPPGFGPNYGSPMGGPPGIVPGFPAPQPPPGGQYASHFAPPQAQPQGQPQQPPPQQGNYPPPQPGYAPPGPGYAPPANPYAAPPPPQGQPQAYPQPQGQPQAYPQPQGQPAPSGAPVMPWAQPGG